MSRTRDQNRFVVMGRLAAPYGVQGWIRVQSETEPRDRILAYSPWYLRRGQSWQAVEVEAGRRHGDQVVVRLAGCADRDAAGALRNLAVAVRRDQFAEDLDPGEYYWADLEGLTVVTRDGVELGTVARLLETGANDVMVVRGDRERLVPYITDRVVLGVDLEAGRILVDWDPEF